MEGSIHSVKSSTYNYDSFVRTELTDDISYSRNRQNNAQKTSDKKRRRYITQQRREKRLRTESSQSSQLEEAEVLLL